MNGMFFKKNYSEYKPEKLPENRKEQYFDILKHNVLPFLLIGFIFLLFCLPVLISLFVRDYYFAVYSSHYASGEITAEQYESLTRSLLQTMNIVVSCCFLFLAFPFAGCSKMLRCYVWSEQVFFFHDFFHGIKENFLKVFAFFLVIAASIYGLYTLQTLSGLPWVARYLPYGAFAILVLPPFLHFAVLINIYSQSAGKSLKNSFVLYFKTPFLTILFAALPLLSIYLVSLIDYVAIRLLVHSILIVAILPPYLLLWFTYAVSVLDKCVNKTLFPEVYKKGLYTKGDQKTPEEEEDEEEDA